jgi:hypothetical protein
MHSPVEQNRKSKVSIGSIADAEDFMQKDRFAEHKRQYELHAAAWLDARARGDQKLSRKSAQQMLRHLQKMYRLALSSRS